MLSCENKYSNQSWGRICRGICIGKYPLFSSNSLPVLGRITLVVPGASPILGQYPRVNCSGELWVDHCSLQPQAHQSYGWKAHWPHWAAFPRLPLRRSPVTLETHPFGKTRRALGLKYQLTTPTVCHILRAVQRYWGDPHTSPRPTASGSYFLEQAPDLFLPYLKPSILTHFSPPCFLIILFFNAPSLLEAKTRKTCRLLCFLICHILLPEL